MERMVRERGIREIRDSIGGKAVLKTDEMNRQFDGFSYDIKDLKPKSFPMARNSIYTAIHADIEFLVCKVVPMKTISAQVLQIQRYVGSPPDDEELRFGSTCGQHPCLARVYDIFISDTTVDIDDKKVFIFQSETDPKSIVDKFKKMETVDEAEAKKTLQQLAECIQYLHSVGVAHLNLRNSSVVQDKTTGVKVVGMDGCTFYWDSDNEAVLTRKRLPTGEFTKRPHLPPEAFNADTWSFTAADVWAFGLLMCQVLAKDPPYVSINISAEDQWMAFSERNAFSDEAKQLLDRIFVEDPHTRPSISDVLNDTYFKNVA